MAGNGMAADKQRGLSLVSLLCALVASSMLVCSGLRFLPRLQSDCRLARQNIWLINQLEFSMLKIEKEIRRAGFHHDNSRKRALSISRHSGERPDSCLMLNYAYYHPQARNFSGELVDQTFGYRLRKHALEARRNAAHCDEPGWVNIHDGEQMHVTALQFEMLGADGIRVTLDGRLAHAQKVSHRIVRLVARRNG